jgi:hypothetical protein
VQIPDKGLAILAVDGRTRPDACDALARWCLERVGLEPFGITAPSWGCSYRTRLGEPGVHFGYWSLDEYTVGIFHSDPDAEPKPPREDGHPRHPERGNWDRLYVIPDMPIPEDIKLPMNGTQEERNARIDAERPKRLLTYALALAHFARWLLTNTEAPG